LYFPANINFPIERCRKKHKWKEIKEDTMAMMEKKVNLDQGDSLRKDLHFNCFGF
jgi:hypothetical protein